MVSLPTGKSISDYQEDGFRPTDSRRDLGAIADLIELCFQDTMDAEGKGYLRQLREAARYGWLASWTSSFFEEGVYPLMSGYVWIADHRLVGNLSLFPFNSAGRKCVLIANVAVHPDFRGRGIATELTHQAIEYARRQRVFAAWLQVRDDNPPALHLYNKLGFKERASRTTWATTAGRVQIPDTRTYVLGGRDSTHWPLQKAWLERLYPAELSWHLPVNWRALRPGLQGSLFRFFALNYPRHWAIQRNGDMLGVLTWLQTPGYTDPLLLATPADLDEQAIQILLASARRQLPSRRKMTLNLPSAFANSPLQAAGFIPQQTLIWMESRLLF